MYFSKIAVVCLLAVASARPQRYNDYNTVETYSDIDDENDPRYGWDSNPQYTYKYQVSDEKEQTYIAHDENRNGAAVTGQYSYVDALGSLIIVKYTADDSGYTETREVQENFLTVRAKPKPVVPKPTPAPRRPDNSDLIAKIISQLTPYIKQSVSDSLSAQYQQPQVSSSSSLFGEDGENRITVESKNYDFDHFLF